MANYFLRLFSCISLVPSRAPLFTMITSRRGSINFSNLLPTNTKIMEFTQNVYRNPTIRSDIIIGVIDTGLWPDSISLNSGGLGPPPKKWKGSCKGGKSFTCNKWKNAFGDI
ncbi:PREDICTED: cucumisin-like [Erythranthe guttata]|uniref:cucumisin-like n=1 Tax=Erythranthe guttata TaxID=4155 RepID=UPI00064DA70B|nr:PREDICTED: cucumisin-like [Erythranthe guttata]|eukprot:XP_012845407.1 PREDICTED: cucumisin-like [Erythranthe guttata]